MAPVLVTSRIVTSNCFFSAVVINNRQGTVGNLYAVASLHAAGMVHRDVKPANCLFVGGQLKLADFGLLTEAHPLVSRVGTQKYMPPDGRMDMRADVYAAGLVIYEMLTGLPVDEFPRLGRRALELSKNATLAALFRLVLRACERDPERRFADARAMLVELERPVKSSRHLPKRRWLTACAMGIMAAAGLAAWAIVPIRVDRSMVPEPVDVSFVTDPFEANIYLDGVLLRDTETDVPYSTPCTVERLPVRTYHVEFEREGQPRWDAGNHDFARTRQIVSRAR